jgi:hypothetical protein
MADDLRRVIFGVFMAGLAFLGLILFGNARDVGIELFGFGLMVFGILFGRVLIARHFAAQEDGK